MGRRRAKKKPPQKKKMLGTLETQFTCPFCNHEKSCDVKMDRTRNVGVISCRVCLEDFQTSITWSLPDSALWLMEETSAGAMSNSQGPLTNLSEPVDVYSDWIDACEQANA